MLELPSHAVLSAPRPSWKDCCQHGIRTETTVSADMKLARIFSRMLLCIYVLHVRRLPDTLSPEQDFTHRQEWPVCPLRMPDMEVADVELPGLTGSCLFRYTPPNGGVRGWGGDV